MRKLPIWDFGFLQNDQILYLYLAQVVSFVACLRLLLCALPKVKGAYRKRLLLRQVWHLALADLVSVVGGLASSFGASILIPAEVGNPFCDAEAYIVWPLGAGLGAYSSLAFEAHIAASLVVRQAQMDSVTGLLERGLVWIWPLALVAAVSDHFFGYRVKFDKKTGMCLATRTPLALILTVIAVVVICTVSYIALICNERRHVVHGQAPQSVSRRLWLRGSLYCLVALVVYGPYAGYWFVAGKPAELNWPTTGSEVAVAAMFSLGAFANYLLYTVHCSYMRKLRALSLGPGAAFSAGPAAAGGRRTSRDCYDVRFATDVLEVTLSADGSGALSQSALHVESMELDTLSEERVLEGSTNAMVEEHPLFWEPVD